MIASLGLLQKIENLSIRNFQSKMQELSLEIDAIDQKIQMRLLELEKEKKFYQETGSLDYSSFAKRVHEEIMILENEKKEVEDQFDKFLEKLREHASNEKSYELLKKKNIKILNMEELKKSEETIADIINNKYISQNAEET